MTPSKKLLVLAIDAASPQLLRSWADDGTLPNISRLMSDALIGELNTVDTLYPGSIWPSFYTASNPAEHGLYWLSQLKCGTYDTVLLNAEDFGCRKALWDVIGEAGLRVLVVDVPLSCLSPQLHGTQIVEWHAHDRIFGFQTTPPALRNRVQQLVGSHPSPTPCDSRKRSHADYRDLANRLSKGAELRGRLSRELLTTEPWNFAIHVFSEAHCAGHQLWHTHDSKHPAFDEASKSTSSDLIRKVYVAIDHAVGEILEQVSESTTVVLMSLHDMSYMAGTMGLLRQILVKLGATAESVPTAPSLATTPAQQLMGKLSAIYRTLPQSFRTPLYEFRTKLRNRLRDAKRSGPPQLWFDPINSKCFDVEMGPAVGGIRLNVRGREPNGILEPGPDCDAFCKELTEQLLAIKRIDNGRPLAKRVLRSSALFPGELADELPDLIVEWEFEMPLGTRAVGNGNASTLAAESHSVGRVVFVNDYCRTGEHRSGGLFAARGPGIKAGELARRVSALDLAPTFAAMLGVEMKSVHGVIIPELLGHDAIRISSA